MKNFKTIEVISIETNEKIKIKDYRFNPEFHKHIKEQSIKEKVEITDNV